MKKSFLLPVLFALILGYLCANFVLAEYDSNTSSTLTNVYFLQGGAYNSLESSLDDLSDITNKITVKEDNKYYTYLGMTTSIKEAERIKELYKENDIELYIKSILMDNTSFVTELEQYDILLKNSKTLEEVNSVLKTVVATYEERVLNR